MARKSNTAKTNEKGATSRSKTKKATVTISTTKSSKKGVKTPQRTKKQKEPIIVPVVDKSRKKPQEVEVKIIYNPEKKIKYLMTDLSDKEAFALIKRIWQFYRQLKKARKLEKKLEKSRGKMVEALNNISEKEEDD